MHTIKCVRFKNKFHSVNTEINKLIIFLVKALYISQAFCSNGNNHKKASSSFPLFFKFKSQRHYSNIGTTKTMCWLKSGHLDSRMVPDQLLLCPFYSPLDSAPHPSKNVPQLLHTTQTLAITVSDGD